MNILRLLRLKKQMGELDNITQEESLFFNLHEKYTHNSENLECYQLIEPSNNFWVIEYYFDKKEIWVAASCISNEFNNIFGKIDDQKIRNTIIMCLNRLDLKNWTINRGLWSN